MTDYATLEALKSYLRIPDSDTVDDAELQRAITTASSEIDHLCSRTFEPVQDPAVTRYYEAWYDRHAARWVLPIDDVQTTGDITGVDLWNPVTEDYDEPETGWILNRTTKRSQLILPTGTTYAPGGAYDSASSVAVTAKYGWADLPEPVVSACLIIATRIFKRRESEFGLIATLDGSQQTRLTRVMDPDAAVALKPYIRYWAMRR